MKGIYSILLSCCVWHASAADADLARLQKSYDEAAKRALAPLQATYVQQLQKLLEQRTKAGQLDAALEVKAVLEQFGQTPSPQAATPVAVSAPDEAALRKKIMSGKFVFFFDPPRSKLMTFRAAGKIDEGGAVQESRWKLEGNDLLIYNESGQLSHAVTYDAGTDSFKPSSRATLWMSRKAYMERTK